MDNTERHREQPEGLDRVERHDQTTNVSRDYVRKVLELAIIAWLSVVETLELFDTNMSGRTITNRLAIQAAAAERNEIECKQRA